MFKGSMAMIMAASVSLFSGASFVGATTSSVTGDISVSPSSLSCKQSTDVNVKLTGQAGITQNPTDVMLVLDRSGSMGGTPIGNLKTAANKFIDIIDEGSDGQLDGVIANGSRVGVVSFADNATTNKVLSTNATDLKNTINSLAVGGLTNHEAAFQTAQTQLSASSPSNKKIMIMFTDGLTTVGGSPDNDAANARAAGTEIYSIGLGSVNTGQLNNWATDPDSGHVFITPNASALESIFKGVGAAIVSPAATGISINEKVNSNFSVSNVNATKGTSTSTGNEIGWTIPTLSSEDVALTFTITHTGSDDGNFQLNDLITYSDAEGQNVTFPTPVVKVTGCDTTPPVTNPVLSEDDCGQDGWYREDVLLTLNATDDKSGVAKTEYSVTHNGVSDGVWNEYSGPVTFSEEGSYTIKYRSTDNAGNVEAEKSVSFNIDKTKPTLNLTLDKTVLWPPNHKLVPINVTVDAKDPNGSGIKSIQLVSITSNEPDNGLGDGDTENDIQDATFNTDDRSFSLRAERSGNGTGRVYTITYKVVDEACNETIATATVTVPHDQSKK